MREQTVKDGGSSYRYGSISVEAAPGEINTLELSYEAGAFVISDRTAPLTGHGRCRNRDAHTVVCDGSRLDSINAFYADLGDMDDSARAVQAGSDPYVKIVGGAGRDRLTGVGATLEGGDGDDHLVGGTYREVLDGEAGNDTLEGHGENDQLYSGTGDDTLLGGDGHDNLYAGGGDVRGALAGTDHLDGGAGNDLLSDQDRALGGPVGADTVIGGEGRDFLYSYVGRHRAVVVDLSKPHGNGERGENDTVTGIEDIYGGGGDDTLIGDVGPNRIEGNRGHDDIRGGAGDDHLISSGDSNERRPNGRAALYGPDRVSGSAGDDLIETLATLESEVSCGDGRDRVVMPGFSSDHAHSSRGPLISASCERLAMGGSRARGPGASITPYPTTIEQNAFVFTLQTYECCRERIELQTVQRGPRRLAATILRRKTVRLRVHDAAARADRGVRGKITGVARNRFVWRFRRGF